MDEFYRHQEDRYLVAYRDESAAACLEPMLREKGFALERILELKAPLPHVRRYSLSGRPEDWEPSLVYARGLEGILSVELEKTDITAKEL